MQQVDIVALARRTVETVRPFMDEQRHEFIVTLPANPICTSGDPTRLEQILIKEQLGYRIFTTDVTVRGAKWSRIQTQ